MIATCSLAISIIQIHRRVSCRITINIAVDRILGLTGFKAWHKSFENAMSYTAKRSQQSSSNAGFYCLFSVQ